MTRIVVRYVAVVLVLIRCSAVLASGVSAGEFDPTKSHSDNPDIPPQGVVLFDLHDPELMTKWVSFLATTPMPNDTFLSQPLQKRLASIIETYRLLTPTQQPQFFVAADLQLIDEQLRTKYSGHRRDILPLRHCPVFASGRNAPVSSLLALTSGLPAAVFSNAPGESERYRFLLLQTEYSHCRLLATIRSAEAAGQDHPFDEQSHTAPMLLLFNLAMQPRSAMVSSTTDLRALVEAIGDVEAIAAFKTGQTRVAPFDEVDVFMFARLLSLLAAESDYGYAAIPLLYRQLGELSNSPISGRSNTLWVSEARKQSRQIRAVFRKIVPFAIRGLDDLERARNAVVTALANGEVDESAKSLAEPLLQQFVAGSEMLLAKTVAQKKMPLTRY